MSLLKWAAKVGPTRGWGMGLEEPTVLDEPHICPKLVRKDPWWPSLGVPAFLTRLRAPGPRRQQPGDYSPGLAGKQPACAQKGPTLGTSCFAVAVLKSFITLPLNLCFVSEIGWDRLIYGPTCPGKVLSCSHHTASSGDLDAEARNVREVHVSHSTLSWAMAVATLPRAAPHKLNRDEPVRPAGPGTKM